MPLFIALSLALCFMVQTASSLQSLLVSPLVIYIGLAVAMLSILGIFLKKWPDVVWYDLFSASTLVVWFAYWKPLFKDDSPVFFFYPLYFALMTAFVSLFFIGQRDKIDDESFRFMLSLSKKTYHSALACHALCFRQFGITATFHAVSNPDDAIDYEICFSELPRRPQSLGNFQA